LRGWWNGLWYSSASRRVVKVGIVVTGGAFDDWSGWEAYERGAVARGEEPSAGGEER
jgi:hypothetical protein